MRLPVIREGNAKSTIAPATSTYHAYRGMRLILIPGGRDFSTPTINSTAAAMAATSINENPSSHMSAPMPGSYLPVKGGYMNHPPFGAALKKIDPQRKVPPSKNAQNP